MASGPMLRIVVLSVSHCPPAGDGSAVSATALTAASAQVTCTSNGPALERLPAASSASTQSV